MNQIKFKFFVLLVFIFFLGIFQVKIPRVEAVEEASVGSPFLYTFNNSGVLEISTYIQNTTSPYFWVSSGGRMIMNGGLGQTIQGPLEANDPDRLSYSVVNPLDTGNGYYPQNTFRLVTRSEWGNSEEQVSFRINKTNLTNTPNRDRYSGIFVFSRYSDKDDLYYAGIRHDGLAIIKKKIGSVYYSLVYKQVYGSGGDYHKWSNPNLIPENKWIGLRLKTTNNTDGSVRIELLLDKDNNGIWKSILVTTDKGVGGAPFREDGKGGIRTDYMDVMFDNFKIKSV